MDAHRFVKIGRMTDPKPPDLPPGLPWPVLEHIWVFIEDIDVDQGKLIGSIIDSCANRTTTYAAMA